MTDSPRLPDLSRTVYYTDLPKGYYIASVHLHNWGDRYLMQVQPNSGSVAIELLKPTFDEASEALDAWIAWVKAGPTAETKPPCLEGLYSASY